MSKLLPALLVGALLAVVAWFFLSTTDRTPVQPPAADAGTAVAAKRPLEAIAVRDAAVDAAPIVDATLTAEHLKQSGVLGRPLEVSLAYMQTMPWWRRVGTDDAPAFESERKVRFSFVVEGGRVVGARATFPKDALSADVPVMSPALIGQMEALPGGPDLERLDPDSPVDRSGTVTTSDGRTFHWRAKLRSGKGEGPFGPESFEIRTGPFDQP